MGQLCESCSRGRWSASCRAQRARNYGKNAHKLSLFVSVFLRFTCEILLGSTNQINPKINCAMIHKGLWLVKFAACIGECTLTLLNIAIVKKCTVFFLFKSNPKKNPIQKCYHRIMVRGPINLREFFSRFLK